MQSTQKTIDVFLNPYEVVKFFGLREGMFIADFGAGAGHFTTAMARKVGNSGEVNAIDIRQEVLEAIRGYEELEKLYQIETIRGDLEADGGSHLPAGSQDLVLCANILHIVQNKDAVLKEAHRVLKKGGRLIVIDWNINFAIGPAKDLRLSEDKARSLAEGVDFTFKKELDVASSHYALEFTK
ncbi:MAG: hypothetical protein A2932_00815 [Candidatus Spechtbacteria bacterium RIFCSPLOWO2_01_FULL_46_10]|uniref:Methyltransferase domain-containing protein n=1 Tax=Candidatus Spechtbacteria bacterium RIFCSPLOWO2_01_FULL_46_10 TaxID=1802163 RepID=A0A1G2HEJ0_9BACT|nr:MAG: hypothetical protein A2932_00815 [Candidatus Spechtbacteria bacterium RIFCSPLOWO2_01_FULL_46_10]